ncbi:MAG: 6-hydroxymethylpterin diphosphokinase MptE-like protein, partial [Spirochaetota bacterium]|nr:6-hydroxymethylpterin diphosphokinase MptE-like protein [Spirochaetota bacterium]
SDLLTRFEFEEKWIENIMGNIYNIFCSTPVLDLFSKFKNYPGIIVSAGPSLAKNVKLLNNIRDKAIIVCVDTALKVLQKNNISPHIVITLDSQKYSIKHFQGLKDHNPILLADLVSYPRVIDSYKGRKILSTTSKYYFDKNGNTKRETTPVMDWIEEYISPIGDIQSGGSVATSAFDLLLNLGCSSIVLLGQDLAYTGREIHSRGTHHNDDWLPITSRFRNLETINQNVIRRRKIKYVTSYDGKGDVLSDFVFDLYRHWFEDSAAKVSIPVINATEGGAKIKNTQQYTLKELVKNTPKMEVSPQEIFEKVISQNIEQNPQMLIDGIKSAEESLDEIKSISEKLLKEDFPSDEKLYQVIDEKNISKLLNPFLRRTFLFLARHQDICYEKYMKNFISDVAVASNKVIKLLKDSQRRLETLR